VQKTSAGMLQHGTPSCRMTRVRKDPCTAMPAAPAYLTAAATRKGPHEGCRIPRPRAADDHADLLADLAAELAALKVAIIVASGSQAIGAARRATSTIPVVMASSSDPLGSGFVASLARPGGHTTGLSRAATG
jgi:ABC-type uncharacterized transport system substrate-binding protein